MIAPGSYTAQLENAPYERLIAARRHLVTKLERLEKGFKDPQPNEWECVSPGSDTRYKMTLEHLEALTALMRKRANEITG